jgi:heme-degrading monooxygenase HmoA
MMTVITDTTVKSGHEADWDAAYRERAGDARKQDGWVDLHLLIPEDAPNMRVVVGTWRDKAAWEHWHGTEGFQRTRDALNAATESDGSERWFTVQEQLATQPA